jgi:choline dehydrogenase-like flavoprotein
LIPEAFATGNLTIITDALVQRVDVDAAGRAEGVSYVDRSTGTFHSVTATFTALAAGAFSSVRILLNSRNSHWPNGVGNARGLVGKYIMDSVEYTLQGHIPALEAIPPQNDDGIFTPHIYVPWWLYQEQVEGKLDFARGYHIEPRGGRRLPTMALGGYVEAGDHLYGGALRSQIRRRYGSYVFLTGEGEMIPNEHTYCSLDPQVTDKWGFPVLRFNWQWGDQERRQAQHMQDTFRSIFKLLGGTTLNDGPLEMPVGGEAIHEVGGARMGFSREDSVLDQYGQCWDAGNLFVLDGANFASSPDKNPTLTILALASRGANRIIALQARGGS